MMCTETTDEIVETASHLATDIEELTEESVKNVTSRIRYISENIGETANSSD